MKFSDNKSYTSGRLHAKFCSVWTYLHLSVGAHFFLDTLSVLRNYMITHYTNLAIKQQIQILTLQFIYNANGDG